MRTCTGDESGRGMKEAHERALRRVGHKSLYRRETSSVHYRVVVFRRKGCAWSRGLPPTHPEYQIGIDLHSEIVERYIHSLHV